MAIPRWLKWTAAVVLFLGLALAVLVAGGVWILSSATSPDVALGEPLPVVELATLSGDEPIEIEGFRGQVVVLDFWASW